MKMLRASIRGSVFSVHPDHGLLGVEAEFCSQPADDFIQLVTAEFLRRSDDPMTD
jgi:hypothetical protein